MNKEKITANLAVLMDSGVVEEKIDVLATHLARSYEYVYPQDLGQSEAVSWFNKQVKEVMTEEESELMSQIVATNLGDNLVEYIEAGYDSNQSHRKVAKIAGEAFLIGGLSSELALCGHPMDLVRVQEIIESKMTIENDQLPRLCLIAEKYGSSQDFLFPGVIPTDQSTPSLEEYSVQALKGKPYSSVRCVTGVGGLRYDKDWNHVTDLVEYVDLKVREDKRYYPGLGLFYALVHADQIDEFPIMQKVARENTSLYASIHELESRLKKTKKVDYSGVSVLCSTYLPNHRELSDWQYEATSFMPDLASAFHSPAYEFSMILDLFKKIERGESGRSLDVIKVLQSAASRVWSFNSTIHLPWTGRLAGLSNDLMGQITNRNGDYAIRYGVGWRGKSIEVREYHYGARSRIRGEGSGEVAHALYYYGNSEIFEGEASVDAIPATNPFWSEVKSGGLLKTCLNRLESEK